MGLALCATPEERIANKSTKEIPEHIINRKADKKLDYVAEIYGMVIDEKLIRKKTQFLKKTLYCEGFRFIKCLNLNYTYENRLWAFSYNLNYETTIDFSEQTLETKPCRFIVKNKGKMGTTGAQWVDGGSECSKEAQDQYLNMLNNKLIIDRIVSLDMTNVEVTYNPRSCCWKISCRTLIGSTTWILIPPVINLIKPQPEECIKMLEFFELTADAVANKTGAQMISHKI